MVVTFTVANFKGRNLPFGILSMAIFRILFIFKKHNASFRKLMGSGQSGTFDKKPNWNQWAYLYCWENLEDFEKFQKNGMQFKYLKYFANQQFTIFLNPIQSHGLWDNQNPFLNNNENLKNDLSKPVAVLTRANIRPQKAISFWENVPMASQNLRSATGYIYSIGIGEIPLLKQATFSIWENLESMKKFAYKNQNHGEVIKLKKQQNWYSEELFARFEIIKIEGKTSFFID